MGECPVHSRGAYSPGATTGDSLIRSHPQWDDGRHVACREDATDIETAAEHLLQNDEHRNDRCDPSPLGQALERPVRRESADESGPEECQPGKRNQRWGDEAPGLVLN